MFLSCCCDNGKITLKQRTSLLKKAIWTCMFATVLPGLSMPLCLGGPNDPVVFNDANLKTAVENRLGLNPTENDMLGLTYLGAIGFGVTDLVGLEYAENMTDLFLHSNNISNLSPLGNLTGLTRLYLENNNISDINPLENLRNLIDLDLEDNNISDISSLGNLTHLRYLDLQSNPLNVEAYYFRLPEIEANNPSLSYLQYDPYTGPPALALISPDWGDTLLGGREQLIQWSSFGYSAVNISYTNLNSSNSAWIARVPSDDGAHNFSWITPQVNLEKCLVKIMDANAPGPSIPTAQSGIFNIIPCNLTMPDRDLNDDCRIDLADFAAIAESWLANGFD